MFSTGVFLLFLLLQFGSHLVPLFGEVVTGWGRGRLQGREEAVKESIIMVSLSKEVDKHEISPLSTTPHVYYITLLLAGTSSFILSG